jgi:serine/threonine-protein kinase
MRAIPQAVLGIPADRYTVDREIGRGGYATVYLARDLRHQRNVAIKVLNIALAAGAVLERFQSEIAVAASLAHPNIVPVFDSGVAGDTLFFVMPHVEGESLRARLDREGALPLDDALRIARDMANALTYAHGRNVIHRDIKPENVLLMQSGGNALIADFGIAKVLSGENSGRLTRTGSVVGTPLYMSPEQSFGMTVDARADIYSFAAVVFEMVAGVPSMPGSGAREGLVDTPTGEIPTPSTTPARLPRAMRAVLAKALSADPKERYATVEEFMAALDRAAGVGGRSRVGLPGAHWTIRPRTVLTTAVALVAIAAGSVYAVRATADDAAEGMGLVIFPFRATTPAAGEWREAIPDLMATHLDGTPGIRVADPWSLWLPLRESRGDVARSPDPEEARNLARRANACCYVLGTVAQVPGRIDVSIRVYRATNDEPLHTFTVGGPPDSVGSVMQRASLELIQRLASAERSGHLRVQPALPASAEALKSWLVAREYLRRGRFDSADVAITRSLANDSGFAPTLVDAASIRSWLQFSRAEPYSGLRELAERAIAVVDTQQKRTWLRAQAMLASIRTDGPGVERATTAILAMDPTDFEAWNLLSYSHMAYGWQYGVKPAQVKEAAERLYQFDTTSLTSLARRVYVAVSMNDPADVRAQLARLRRSDTAVALTRGMLRGIDALFASDAEFRSQLVTLRRAEAAEWISALRLLRLYRPDRTEEFARATLADATAPSRPIALGGMAQLMVGGSRWRAIDSMRAAGAFAVRPGFEWAVHRMTVAAGILGAATPERAADAASQLAAGMPPDSALALFNRRSVWHDGWLIGAFHASYGDTVLASRWATAMGTLPSGGSPKEYARALQADILSRLALRRGDRDSALAHARRAFALWDVHSENTIEMMPEPAIRFQFATLLRDAGRRDSASALLSSLVPPTTWMGFYSARAALELAELKERSGERREAERHYLLASALWARTDPEFASFRRRAREGLRRLSD